jgi:RNA polymerase sigma-70 factor, ECF subfamily
MAETAGRNKPNPLVERARHGDRDAFAELAVALSPRLLAAAGRVVGNRADAEDVAQESLTKAFQHLRDFRGEAAFSTWLTRIAVNQGIALLRRRRRDPLALSVPPAPPDEADLALDRRPASGPTPEEIYRFREFRRVVGPHLEGMDAAYKTPLCLAALDGWSYAEIAERLGVSMGTVKTRIHRARRRLRETVRRAPHSGVGVGQG